MLGMVPIMDGSERFAWTTMTDEQLLKRLKEESKRARRSLDKKERAIAHSNVRSIQKERTLRYEAKWGLE